MCCALALATGVAAPGAISASGPPESQGGGSEAGTLSGPPLVTPGSPDQAEQALAVREADRDSPAAVSARDASQTEYEGMDDEQAARLAGAAFPEAVEHPSGGLPPLPAGARVVSYPSDNVARLDLPGSKHAVIESTGPLAMETSPGRRAAIALSLSEVNGAFKPFRSPTGLRIPRHLDEGATLTRSGVSLTPVDAEGHALNGSDGAIDGSALFYGGTGTDTDSLIKPTSFGFDADTILRSVRSPRRLFFRVGLPAGARLVAAKGVSASVDVVAQGATIATVSPPLASDAEGTQVPVAMSVSGDS